MCTCVTARGNSTPWNITVVTRAEDQDVPHPFCKGPEAAPQTSKPCYTEAVQKLELTEQAPNFCRIPAWQVALLRLLFSNTVITTLNTAGYIIH